MVPEFEQEVEDNGEPTAWSGLAAGIEQQDEGAGEEAD